MSAPVLTDKRRPQLLTVLFWIGVGLAPIAALILLVADGNGPLRFAAVLAITAVVLIGLSIALRADGGAAAEDVSVELEQLRRELRSEIVAAAQRGNQALDRAQRAEDQVVGLRHRLAAGAGIAAAAGDGAPTGSATAAGNERPGTVNERASAVDERAGAGRARVPAPDRQDDAPAGRRRAAEETPAPRGRATLDREDDEPAGGRNGGERPASGQAGVYGGPGREPRGFARAPEPAPRPLGVVRHTETVHHVTTRHTVMDGPQSPTGNTHGGGYPDRSWPDEHRGDRSWPEGPHDDDRPWPDERRGDRSWPDEHRADRSDDVPDDRSWPGPLRDGRSWPGAPGGVGPDGQRDDRWDDLRDDRPSAGRTDRGRATGSYAVGDADWSTARSGDRWAEVRDDGHAREVRVGERRAEVRADGFRYADRWAALRQEGSESPRVDERRANGSFPTGDAARGADSWDGPAREYDDEEPRGGWPGQGQSAGWPGPVERPALPAGGVPVPREWRPARGQRPVDGRQPADQPWPQQPGDQAWPEQPGDQRWGEQPGDQRWGEQPGDQRWGEEPVEERRGRRSADDREPADRWRPPAQRDRASAEPQWDRASAEPHRGRASAQPPRDREPAEPPRGRASAEAWRDPRGQQQWGGADRYGHPQRDEAPRWS